MILARAFHPAVVLAASSVLSLWAIQDPAQPNPNTTKPPAQPQNQDPATSDIAERSDRVLAAWLIIDNNNEVALSKMALDRSKNDEVKRFAQVMIDDHTAFAQKLREFAPGVGGLDSMGDRSKTSEHATKDGQPIRDNTPKPNPTSPQDPNKPTPQPLEPREDGTRRPMRDDDMRPVHAAGVDHVELVSELGRKCLESTKLELNQKQDAEFDLCFLGMQLVAHQQMADKLEVFQRYASPNMRTVLDSGLQTVRTHKDHVKKLMTSVQDLAHERATNVKRHEDHDNDDGP